jgi:hypothetical protein
LPYLEGRLPRNNRFEIDSVHFDLKTMRLIACYHRTGADTSETLYKGLFAEGYLLLREGYVQDQMIPLEYEQAARWMDLRGLDEKKWL